MTDFEALMPQRAKDELRAARLAEQAAVGPRPLATDPPEEPAVLGTADPIEDVEATPDPPKTNKYGLENAHKVRAAMILHGIRPHHTQEQQWRDSGWWPPEWDETSDHEVPKDSGFSSQSEWTSGGRYSGAGATATEHASGAVVEEENAGPLKPGGAGHRALQAFASGERLTAYDASEAATGDFHAVRREATRLQVRGFLIKDGTLPNRAPRGRGHVDAYRITATGQAELARLGD